MKPQVVIARAIVLPLIGLSALFVGTHCNKTDKNTKPKIERPSLSSPLENKDLKNNDGK